MALQEVILQAKFGDSDYLIKKRNALLKEFRKDFGCAVEAKQCQSNNKFAVEVPRDLFFARLHDLKYRIYLDPEKNIVEAKKLFKDIKPTYQKIGLRKDVTLLGFLLRVHMEYPQLPKFNLLELKELLNPPHVADDIRKFIAACEDKKETDPWGNTSNNTWKIVCGMIELICAKRPQLKKHNLLDLAMQTSVQSPIQEGQGAKLYQVIGQKVKDNRQFKDRALQWGVETPQWRSMRYQWTNPETLHIESVDTRAAIDLCQSSDDDDMFEPVVAVHDRPCPTRPQVTAGDLKMDNDDAENYMENSPLIFQLMFEHHNSVYGCDDQAFSNEAIRNMAHLLLEEMNFKWGSGRCRRTDTWVEASEFSDDGILEEFQLGQVSELIHKWHTRNEDPSYGTKFDGFFRKINAYLDQWGLSPISFLRVCGYVKSLHQRETSGQDQEMADVAVPPQPPPARMMSANQELRSSCASLPLPPLELPVLRISSITRPGTDGRGTPSFMPVVAPADHQSHASRQHVAANAFVGQSDRQRTTIHPSGSHPRCVWNGQQPFACDSTSTVQFRHQHQHQYQHQRHPCPAQPPYQLPASQHLCHPLLNGAVYYPESFSGILAPVCNQGGPFNEDTTMTDVEPMRVFSNVGVHPQSRHRCAKRGARETITDSNNPHKRRRTALHDSSVTQFVMPVLHPPPLPESHACVFGSSHNGWSGCHFQQN